MPDDQFQHGQSCVFFFCVTTCSRGTSPVHNSQLHSSYIQHKKVSNFWGPTLAMREKVIFSWLDNSKPLRKNFLTT